MRTRLKLCGLFLAGSMTAGWAAPAWDSSDGSILPVSQGPALLKQCSRAVPEAVTGYWAPDIKQVSELEMRAPAAFEGQLAKRTLKPLSSEFLRQYVGIVSSGIELIYVNAFPRDHEQYIRNWRSRAKVICDGGPDFFGAAYNPATGTFTQFWFNGAL